MGTGFNIEINLMTIIIRCRSGELVLKELAGATMTPCRVLWRMRKNISVDEAPDLHFSEVPTL